MSELSKQKIEYFIGIDISKNKLDVAVLCGDNLIINTVILNTMSAIESFLNSLPNKIKGYSPSTALYCMESTGIYANHLLEELVRIKTFIIVENALHIKRSMGLIRDKTDKKDAHRIALYAQRHFYQLRLWKQPRPIVVRLQQLSELRDRLVTISTMLQTPLKEHKKIFNEVNAEYGNSCVRSISAIKGDIQEIEKSVTSIIRSDPRIRHLFQLVTSVPGIGKHTALHLIIKTNEFKNFSDAKKLACYAGVAPFKFESGLSTTRARVSPYADRKLKSLLHICAVRVVRLNGELREYYLRKTNQEKKSKMCVINAIRNKLIRRVFACVTEDRPFEIRESEPN